MKFYPLLAVVVLFVAGPLGIAEAYSPFGGYNRALLGNVWVRANSQARPVGGADVEDEADDQRMIGEKRPAGSPVFHSALAYGKRAGDDEANLAPMQRRGFHSALPFGKRTAMERRGYHSAMPFGKRDEEDAGPDALVLDRRAFNSALMFGKRINSALPFGKRNLHSALPFGKRASSTEDEEEALNAERRGYHSALPFGKRNDEDTQAAVNDILSQLRNQD